METKTISAQVPKELADAVVERAVQSDRSFSACVRIALSLWLSVEASK